MTDDDDVTGCVAELVAGRIVVGWSGLKPDPSELLFVLGT